MIAICGFSLSVSSALIAYIFPAGAGKVRESGSLTP